MTSGQCTAIIPYIWDGLFWQYEHTMPVQTLLLWFRYTVIKCFNIGISSPIESFLATGMSLGNCSSFYNCLILEVWFLWLKLLSLIIFTKGVGRLPTLILQQNITEYKGPRWIRIYRAVWVIKDWQIHLDDCELVQNHQKTCGQMDIRKWHHTKTTHNSTLVSSLVVAHRFIIATSSNFPCNYDWIYCIAQWPGGYVRRSHATSVLWLSRKK